MARTIVGGLGDEAGLECGERSREKDKNSVKKVKWSKMVENGCRVVLGVPKSSVEIQGRVLALVDS